MSNKHSEKVAKLILSITVVFLVVSGICLYYGSHYITKQHLRANEENAMDLAMIVANNYYISDAEVQHMKALTFNQMETDPVNLRLMNIGNDVELNADITNVYVIAALAPAEIKYETDAKTAEFFGYPVGTKLDGIWLMNGIIEDGRFAVKQREDIYRYTQLTAPVRQALENKKPLGEYSADAWGEFITGYAPLYTTEGSFVGLVGIDLAPNKYQASAQAMIFALLGAFLIIAITMAFLFLYFYFKYIKAKEGELYFDFYSRMSHDLRTPMNGILGMAELSKDEQDPEVLRHNFKMVAESGHYMLELINDTLDLQKMDASMLKLNPQKRQLQPIVEAIAELVKIPAAKKQLHFELLTEGADLQRQIEVDELRLKQILINILFNAIKFTPDKGKVQLKVTSTKEYYTFTITDTGIGMSPEFVHSRLFHPFEQEGQTGATQYGGSGLGMAIVHKLVERMQGEIQVASEVGQGTTFRVKLPLPEVKGAVPNTPAVEQQKDYSLLKGKKLLLCEDHPLNIEIMTHLLAKQGCEVTVAHNGQEGVELYQAEPAHTYAAVLMDVRMPVMSGLEATEQIRHSGRADSTSIPIIAVTANAYDDDIRQALELGVNDYVTKPVMPEVLFRVLMQHL